MKNKFWRLILLPMLAFLLAACGIVTTPEDIDTTTEATVMEGKAYDTPEEVATYIEWYGGLPENYITKAEARELGWVAQEANLWDVAPGASIGGDYFGNFEALLPEADGRDYYEADIEYEGEHRNAKRLVFSNDGLYFYTDDHYESFEEIEVGEDR